MPLSSLDKAFKDPVKRYSAEQILDRRFNEELTSHFDETPDAPFRIDTASAGLYDINIGGDDGFEGEINPEDYGVWKQGGELSIYRVPNAQKQAEYDQGIADFEATKLPNLPDELRVKWGEDNFWQDYETWATDDWNKKVDALAPFVGMPVQDALDAGLPEQLVRDVIGNEAYAEAMSEASQPINPYGYIWVDGTYVPASMNLENTKNFYQEHPELLPEGISATLTNEELDTLIAEQEGRRKNSVKVWNAVFPEILDSHPDEDKAGIVDDLVNRLATDEDFEQVFIQRLTDTGRTSNTEELLLAIGATEEQIDEFYPEVVPQEEVLAWRNVNTGAEITDIEYQRKIAEYESPPSFTESLMKVISGEQKPFVGSAEEKSPEEMYTLTATGREHRVTAFKIFGEALIRTPEQAVASLIMLRGEGGANINYPNWMTEWIDSANNSSTEFVELAMKQQGPTTFPITYADIAQIPPSLGFSIVSMGAGGAAAAAVAPFTRAGAWIAGSAASGWAAYQMANYQIMQSYLDLKNEEMQKTEGRNISIEEEATLKADFRTLAFQYGMWEAVPEAISNLAFADVLFRPLAKTATKKIAKGIITKLVELYGTEIGTETITSLGQSRVEVKAGLRDRSLNAFEALKEVAAPTFLLVTITAGSGHVSVNTYNKVKKSLHRDLSDDIELRDMIEEFLPSIIDKKTGVITLPEIAASKPVLNLREEQHESGATVLRDYDANGDATGNFIQYRITETTMKIEGVNVSEELREQGLGTEMYLKVLGIAKSEGLSVNVDLATDEGAAIVGSLVDKGIITTDKIPAKMTEIKITDINIEEKTAVPAVAETKEVDTAEWGSMTFQQRLDFAVERGMAGEVQIIPPTEELAAIANDITAMHNTREEGIAPEAEENEVGSTYNLYDGNLARRKAYSVAGFAERSQHFDGRDVTPQQITDFINANLDLLNRKGVSVGTWYEKGKTTLDVVFAVDDKTAAIDIGRAQGKDVIYDLANNRIIHIPAVTKPAISHYSNQSNLTHIEPEMAGGGQTQPELQFAQEYKPHFKEGWFAKRWYGYSQGQEADAKVSGTPYIINENLSVYDPQTASQEEQERFRDAEEWLMAKFRKEFGANFGSQGTQAYAEVQYATAKYLGYDAYNTGDHLTVFKDVLIAFRGEPVKAVPSKPVPQTVGIPDVPVQPERRGKIIHQSREIVKQDRPGALNKLAQRIPGLGAALRFERPALEVIGTEAEHLLVAQVAEVGALSEVNTKQIVTRLPLFKILNGVFGENVLRGEKSDIEFIGTTKEADNPITGTLLDIVQNPQLYKLTPTQESAVKAINEHNNTTLDYVVNEYGAEIGKFEPNPGGAFLSNVDVSEDVIEWLGSETRAVASGRGKTRVWKTARDRMGGKTPFTPELDVKKLIEGMDSFKSKAAAGVTFKEVAGGLTKLEAMETTHPELYEKMIGLRKRLQRLQGYKRVLSVQQIEALNNFLKSSHEEADLIELDDAFYLQAGRYVSKAMAGTQLADIQAQIEKVKDEIREIRPAWKVANLKPFVFVQEGLYRYFTAKEAKYIVAARQTTNNPVLRFIERWRAGAFSGDFSPFAIQGLIGVQADPVGSLQAFGGAVSKAFENRDFKHSITVDGLMDDIIAHPEEFAEFSSMMGRQLSGTPAEYAAGFLSKIPGFDRFTETTYVTVTRGTFNLWNRTWTRLVESGVPEIEAKVAAIEVAREVYPLVAPAKLGQSQKRSALLRAFPTSYSFIRQPASLISQGSMGYAKLITGQKLSNQERLAIRHLTLLAGSVVATSVTSAVASAIAQGADDDEIWKAVWDAVNPDPYNGKFLSVIVGDFRIPLGGSYRSIFRAIYPQEVEGIPFPVPFAGMPMFIVNRITPAIKTQINLLLNRDYYGTKIIKGEFPENIIRGLLYELEGAVPLSIGEGIGGVRRDEWPEEIAQQVAAQFVGVNLMKLDNTYFHKLVRNLGLPTSELSPLYSEDVDYFRTNNLYGKVTSVLSDVTIEEINKRKGYPPLIKVIIEARDLKREVDLLPNHSPASLDAEKYEDYYRQWGDREVLVAEGGDAVWTIEELVGGRYKTKTVTGEDAVKAFDRKYPQAELGNMTSKQYALLDQYWKLGPEEQTQFLLENPEIGVNPKTDYLLTHPKENAQLAVWGQAKVLSIEAYNESKSLIQQYDIPETAAPLITDAGKSMLALDEESISNYFLREEAVTMYGAQSHESLLVLASDEALRDWYGFAKPSYAVEYYQLGATYRDEREYYDKLKDNSSELYIKDIDDRWAAFDEAYPNNGYRISLAKMQAISKEYSADDVELWAEREQIAIDSGSGNSAEVKIFFFEHPELFATARAAKLVTSNMTEWNEPSLSIDIEYRDEDTKYTTEISERFNNMDDDQVDALQPPAGYNPQWWSTITASKKRDLLASLAREDMLDRDNDYRVARIQRDAYGIEHAHQVSNVPDGFVDSYMSYEELPLAGHRRDRFLAAPENKHFATFMSETIGHSRAGEALAHPELVPVVAYDNIYDDFQDDYERLDGLTDEKSAYYVPDYPLNTVTGESPRDIARQAMLFNKDGTLSDFGVADVKRTGYKELVPETYIGRYTDFKVLSVEGIPASWPEDSTGKKRTWYEDDWYLQEHPSFYDNVYIGLLDSTPYSKDDWERVPTREVWSAYVEEYLKAATAAEKRRIRWNNRPLDTWGQIAFGWTSIENRRTKATPTTAEKTITGIREATSPYTGE